MPTTIREILLDEISKEVVGPHEKNETFVNTDHPKARYLSGVLYPIQTPLLVDDAKNALTQVRSTDGEVEDEKIPINVGTKPSSMGLTCNVPLGQKYVSATISYGRYLESQDKENEDANNKSKGENNEGVKEVKENKGEKHDKEPKTKYPDWKRINHDPEPLQIDLTKSSDRKELEPNVFLRYYVYENEHDKYLTLNVFLTNESKTVGDEFILDSKCVFQPKIKLSSPDSSKVFLNISKNTKKKINDLSLPDRETLFLYRNFKHFAQGRNCSVEWNPEEKEDKTDWVQTTFVPSYVIREIKPREPTEEIRNSLNIRSLSEITNPNEYSGLFSPIVDAYENWIHELEIRSKDWEKDTYFEKNFISNEANIPKKRIEKCRDALERIKEGINKISNDPLIGESFRFANEVMYQSITHAKWVKANKDRISKGQPITEEGPDSQFEPEWRLFQLAFLLLTLESIVNPNSVNRDNADLLWFPTGGGKTEAYFGVIAFTLAYRRLKGRDAKSIEEELDRYGISVIMRYTYRLLTLQQFQRAATLFCACEYVRMKNSENIEKFGEDPFLVGLWVGHDTTPNLFGEAKEKIQQKRRNPNMPMEKTDPIQLLNCPWCGRELNAFNYEFEQTSNNPSKLRPRRIQIRCDKKCFFGKQGDPDRVLPVVLVDEDIRNLRPSLLISTIDKFAQISWNWEYSTLFGYVSQYCKEHGYTPGNAPSNRRKLCRHPESKKILATVGRKLAPPELIIQDELHLIAGPLGTLTGLYETAIDILCTNEITGAKPKIISSTATTKKSDVQIKHLFNSKDTKIFPPQGFEFGDSYFAEVLPTSAEHPGKLHVGVCSTSVSGYNVDSRIAACILRKIRHIHENKNNFHFAGETLKFTNADIDPYYTLVSYYNTIKNLGAAIRMYEDTIPPYMGYIMEMSEKKFQLQNNAPKNPTEILQKAELTGRVSAAKIPTILQNIETKLGDKEVLDALLCTNMLSVGV